MPMNDKAMAPTDYRAQAEKHRHMAEAAGDDNDLATKLLEIAKSYDALAEMMERRTERLPRR